ncbi:MAG: EAL domain-containing protein [Jatrophihabitantaceae bacterium]
MAHQPPGASDSGAADPNAPESELAQSGAHSASRLDGSALHPGGSGAHPDCSGAYPDGCVPADALTVLQRLRAVDGRPLLSSQGGVNCATVLLEPTGTVRWVEGNYAAVTGRDQPMAGSNWPDSLPPELRDAAVRLLAEAGASMVDAVLPCFTPDLRWLRLRVLAVLPPDGGRLLLARLDELSAQADDSLLAQLIRDPLTGLYHRQAFLELAALPTTATARYTGALVVDIRRFRRINEVWGGGAGDRCLVETARWLNSISSAGDQVFRFGGAEFLLLLEQSSAAPALLAKTGSRPIRFGHRQIQLSLQAGWAERADGTSLLRLAEQADTALATAKRQAWRTVVRWTDEIAEQTARAAAAEEAVQQAISAGAESVLFQPVVDLRTGRVSGMEALVRLGGPAAGLPTDLILAASQRLGLTPQFAERIYDLAFADGLRLRSVFPDCLLNINVSREFLSTGLAVDTVLAAARRVGLPLTAVVLELTEEVATELPPDLLLTELGRAAEHGLQLAIDDFGKGETSLALLRKLPLTAIKLDRSLLPVQPDERGWEFVEGVVSLLSKLTGRIIAEGVETPEQSRRLRQLGVYAQQGYLFAEPRDLTYWLANGLNLPGE